MADSTRPVRPGEKLRIPATAWNALMNMLRDSGDTGSGELTMGAARGDVVLVKNASGQAVQRFGVLGISAPIISPAQNDVEFKSRPQLTCGVIDETAHTGKFVVLLEPLAAGAIGRAIISGITIAKVQMNSAGHAWADIRTGQATMQSRPGCGAAQILWSESGTGLKWAVVRLAPPPSAGYAKLTQVDSCWSQILGKPCDTSGALVADGAILLDPSAIPGTNVRGVSLVVGDIVRYLPTTPGKGIILGTYKAISLGYLASVSITDLTSIRLNPEDFVLTAAVDPGFPNCSAATLAKLYTKGLIFQNCDESSTLSDVKQVQIGKGLKVSSGNDSGHVGVRNANEALVELDLRSGVGTTVYDGGCYGIQVNWNGLGIINCAGGNVTVQSLLLGPGIIYANGKLKLNMQPGVGLEWHYGTADDCMPVLDCTFKELVDTNITCVSVNRNSGGVHLKFPDNLLNGLVSHITSFYWDGSGIVLEFDEYPVNCGMVVNSPTHQTLKVDFTEC